MIHIVNSANSEDTGLWIRLESDVLGSLDFYRTGASKVERKLLDEHVRKLLATRMESIRKSAYNMGWKEAKSKKTPKRTHFATTTVLMDWEAKYL